MQTDEITSLKAKIERLEEVNSLLSDLLWRVGYRLSSYHEIIKSCSQLDYEEIADSISNAIKASKSLNEFHRAIN